MNVNVKYAADAVAEAADQCERAAKDLRRVAENVRTRGDLFEMAEAVSIVAQLPGQCRLDLMVTRPIRALKGG